MCRCTMEYYLAIKNESLPCATAWKNLASIMHSEASQRKTNTVIIYMQNTKNGINECNKTDLESTHTSGYQWRLGIEGKGLRGANHILNKL